jgi:hypothetical protein
MKSCLNFSQRMYLIHPIGPQTHHLLGFVVFGSISDRSVALRYSVENGPNYCNKCKKFMAQSCVRIFCNKSTLPTPCFDAFHSVWVHLGLFRYCMKLGAKWVEVVQLIHKFVPRSRVRCFYNERTQSSRLDLKLIYCHVS